MGSPTDNFARLDELLILKFFFFINSYEEILNEGNNKT